MTRIIVNADDFGASVIVNKEIERMILERAISSTTIMANGAHLDEACSFAKNHPSVSYGVHLCLSEFDSITKSPILHKYGVTDEDGRFIRMAIFHISRFPDDLLCAIKEELLAQVAELTALKVDSEVKVANLEKQVKELKESKEFWIKSYNEYEEKYSTFKKDAAAIAQILNTLTK